MSGSHPAPVGPSLFRFIQVELPGPLGPPDGRYLVRSPGASRATHVIVLATLGAPQRRHLARRRRRAAAPLPPPTPVTTARATVIEAEPLDGAQAGLRWLHSAGEPELEAGLLILNGALHRYRVASADPHLHPVGRRHAIVARIGFGAGEQVADGNWTEARELAVNDRSRRRRALAQQARLAAVLGGRVAPLACEELALRARLDLDEGRPREAALQLLVAFDAAIAELPRDAATTPARIAELVGLRAAVAAAANAALNAGSAADAALNAAATDGRANVSAALERLEAALRARAAAWERLLARSAQPPPS